MEDAQAVSQNGGRHHGGDHQKHKRKFSSFFKSLVIELDKDLYGPDNHLVEWHRTTNTNETDGFQVSCCCRRIFATCCCGCRWLFVLMCGGCDTAAATLVMVALLVTTIWF